MENVKFGFAFKMSSGEEFITMYSEENNAKIVSASKDQFCDVTSVTHIVRRGPRAGMKDLHMIYFDDDTVIVVGHRSVEHRLVRVYCDNKAEKSNTDVLVASLKAERKQAKEEMEKAEEAFKTARAKYLNVVKTGDAKLLALLSGRFDDLAI
jgi:hypothetical protein